MGVRRIGARRNAKTGRFAITFEVDPEMWANMARSAKAGAHPDTLDYVAAVINMAFLEDEAGAAKGEDTARAASDRPQPEAEFDDIDDGIPF
jgi:hypothetical protein